jgi:hypothetical protein
VHIWGWAILGVGWVLIAALALTMAAWCSWTATRLDRLHLRCEATGAALRAHLLQRSAAAVELASGGLSDPASALLLLDAAHAAREAEGATQPGSHDADETPVQTSAWLAESDLTQALHAVELPSADAEPLVAELREAARRASMARRIYNDLVATTSALHSRRRVRWFRLAGHAVPPGMADFDDRVP